MNVKNKLISSILAAFMLFTSVPFSASGSTDVGAVHLHEAVDLNKSGEDGESSLPELFVAHIVTDENGKTTHYEDDDGNVVELKDNEQIVLKSNTYPSSYDARTDGLVTSVKDQNPYGTCWAFSAVSNMESFLLKNGMATLNTLDLSENHLIWFTKFLKTTDTTDRTYGDGNNVSDVATAYSQGATWYEELTALSRGSGPADESVSSYHSSIDESLRYERAYSLDDYIYLAYPTSSQLKENIMTYGSVSVSYNSTENGYNGNGTFYDPSNTVSNSNHAVCIVGWDDNYPASNFAFTPASNGAWLVKNSWGTNNYNMTSGYFWLSYCDDSLIFGENYTLMDAVDNVYQYECSGPENAISFYSQSIQCANVFTADGDEMLNGVGFYCFQKNVYYKVKIVTLSSATDNPLSGTVIAEQDGNIPFEGYHTINLTTPVKVTKGQIFAALVYIDTLSSSNSAYFYTEGSGNSCTSGVSFVSQAETGAMQELTAFNLCIKVTSNDDSVDIWDGTVASGFESGTGTEIDPYIIKTAEQLAYLASSVNSGTTYQGKYIKLANDIYLNDTEGWESWGTTAPKNMWTPIGTEAKQFNGVFDGDSHTIFGIYTDSTKDYQGLFGNAAATIENIGIEKSYICGSGFVGSVCGFLESGGIINCYTTGYVSGRSDVGGICGRSKGVITKCYNANSVSGKGFVGGICGDFRNSVIGECYNVGTISGTGSIGGICGGNDNGAIVNCYNTGNVCGTDNCVGGVCGGSFEGNVSKCYNIGTVSGGNSSTGGVCGSNSEGTISDCYNIGTVSGIYFGVGGVCGCDSRGTIERCYNVGKISGSSFSVGGVCGDREYDAIGQCYYLTGCATDGNGTAQNGIGYGELGRITADTSGGTTGLTEAQMKLQSSFIGLNFTTTWTMDGNPDYPYPELIGLPHVVDEEPTEEIDIWDGTIADGFESGTGTEIDPYIIKTPEQLAYLASSVNAGTTYEGKFIKLANDIYLNDTEGWESWGTTAPANIWTPIGYYKSSGDFNCFFGTFDGNGYAVFGVYTDSAAHYQGLFGFLDGTVKNLGIEKSYICGVYYIGGICGWSAGGNIINCYNSGIIHGNDSLSDRIGGVCGANYYGTICNCYNSGTLNGNTMIGGVCGENYNGTISNCYNIGVINGGERVGGVCGQNTEEAIISHCYNIKDVSGSFYVGGVCGLNYASILNCYNAGTVSGIENWTKYVGGVCGKIISGDISSCYNSGTVSGGKGYIGGVCGDNYESTITNCYYLTGFATDGGGTKQFGIGSSTKGSNTADVSGQTTGLTIDQMKVYSSFVGFDFATVWTMPKSTSEYKYPVLRAFNEHEHIFTDSTVEPTCTEQGYDSHKCYCGYETRDNYTNVNPNAHDWNNPTYEWNGNQCTATRTCSRNSNHKETETVTGTYVKDTDATCTTNEFGHYKATFTNTAFAEQTTEKDSVEKQSTALNHDWNNPTYEWNGNQCTATRTCKNNSNHKQTETVTGTYVKDTDATCTTNEFGHYKATFTNTAFAEQTTAKDGVEKTSSSLDHDWNDWVITTEPTADSTGLLERTCKRNSLHKESFILPKLSADNGYTYTEVTPATTEDEGLGKYSYEKGGKTYVIEVVIPKKTATSGTVKLTNDTFATAWGQKFEVTVYAEQLTGSEFYVEIYYDPTVVSFRGVITPGGIEVDLKDNTVVLSSDTPLSSGDYLCIIKFTTSSELCSGEYDFISVNEPNTSAFTKLKIYEIGDVNMDGKVNSRDALMIKQYSVKMITLSEIQLAYADVYVDGKVNSRDALLISQSVVHMPVTLGDRVEVTFVDEEQKEIKRSVHSGTSVTKIPSLPEGYEWSASNAAMVTPVYSNITSKKYYYARKVS